MDTRLILVTIIIALGFMVFVLSLILRGYLTIRYALLWFSTGFLFIILTIFPRGLDIIARIIGIITPANALFFLGLVIILLILLSLTVSQSLLSIKNKKLIQEIAIHELYLKEIQENLKNNR